MPQQDAPIVAFKGSPRSVAESLRSLRNGCGYKAIFKTRHEGGDVVVRVVLKRGAGVVKALEAQWSAWGVAPAAAPLGDLLSARLCALTQR